MWWQGEDVAIITEIVDFEKHEDLNKKKNLSLFKW